MNRRLDPTKNPPQYVDEVLPTRTLKLKGPLERGRVRAPRGTILGSYRITGSFYETATGTYNLRVTRLSVFTGSRGNDWALRHSRDGTVDIIHFETPGQYNAHGGPLTPLYSFGPGTVSWGWIGNNAGGSVGSAYWTGQFMEGIVG